MEPRLFLNLQSACHSLLQTGTTGIHHHARLKLICLGIYCNIYVRAVLPWVKTLSIKVIKHINSAYSVLGMISSDLCTTHLIRAESLHVEEKPTVRQLGMVSSDAQSSFVWLCGFWRYVCGCDSTYATVHKVWRSELVLTVFEASWPVNFQVGAQRLQMYALLCLVFHLASGNSNSVHHTYTIRALPTEPSP